MEQMKYVFISHSNWPPEAELTNRLVRFLNDRGISTWSDADLGPGNWRAQVGKRIREATCFVLVASQKSLSSDEVGIEVEIMWDEWVKNRKILIPYIIDEAYFGKLEGSIDMILGSNCQQAVILSKFADENAAFARLADYLEDIVAKQVNNPADFVYSDNNDILLKYIGSDPIVSIPRHVKEISKDAFRGNRTVERVSIPENVKRIGRRAFFGCNALTSVDGMEGVEQIDASAFGYTAICMEEHNYVLCGIAFGGDLSVKKLCVPTARLIADYAFYGSEAEEIVFPDGLERIGEGAFSDCPMLDRVCFPDTLKTIGPNAFAGCGRLKEAVFRGKLPEGIEATFVNVKIREER